MTRIYYQVGAGPVQSFGVPPAAPTTCRWPPTPPGRCTPRGTPTAASRQLKAPWSARSTRPSDRSCRPRAGSTGQRPGDRAWSRVRTAASTSPTRGASSTTRASGCGRSGPARCARCPARRAPTTSRCPIAPGGRLWLAFRDDDLGVRVVRTNPSATKFGAVRKIKHTQGLDRLPGRHRGRHRPRRPAHQRRDPHLAHAGAGRSDAQGQPQEVAGGQGGRGDVHRHRRRRRGSRAPRSRPRARSARTNKLGKCTLHFPKLKPGKFEALAKKKQYAAGSIRLRVS